MALRSTTYINAAYCSVFCRSVCHTSEPCKNGWTDRVAVRVMGSDGPRESRSPWEGAILGKGAPIVKYMDFLPWAEEKRLNRSICRLGCGLGWAEGSTSSVVFSRCANVPSWEDTLAPHGEYKWIVRLRRRCCLMSNYFDHLLQQVVKVIWQEGPSPPYTDGSVVFARWRQCAPHLVYDSLGPPESTTQTASRSVQPFLHSSQQSVVACPHMSFSLKTAPSFGFLGLPEFKWSNPKRHLDGFSRFYRGMHFSVQRGIAIVILSVGLSVTFVIPD